MAGRIILDDGNRLLDSNANPISGGKVRAYTAGTSTVVSLYTSAALTTAHASPVVANSAGYVAQMWAADDALLDIKVYAANDTTYTTPLREFLNISTAGSGRTKVATRTLLAGLPTSVAVAFLTEAGREGDFVWTSDNVATKVTADVAQGVYVAPSSDTTGASGAWVRVTGGGEYQAQWFGVKPGVTASPQEILNAEAIQNALRIAVVDKREVHLPGGRMYVGESLIPDDIGGGDEIGSGEGPVVIRGQGIESTILVNKLVGGAALFNLGNTYWAEISDLMIEGNSLVGTAGNGHAIALNDPALETGTYLPGLPLLRRIQITGHKGVSFAFKVGGTGPTDYSAEMPACGIYIANAIGMRCEDCWIGNNGIGIYCYRAGQPTFDTVTLSANLYAGFIDDQNEAVRFVNGDLLQNDSANANYASAVFDWPNLADASTQFTNVTTTGAAVGDTVVVSFTGDLLGTTLAGEVTATNTVKVTQTNATGSAKNVASGTILVTTYNATNSYYTSGTVQIHSGTSLRAGSFVTTGSENTTIFDNKFKSHRYSAISVNSIYKPVILANYIRQDEIAGVVGVYSVSAIRLLANSFECVNLAAGNKWHVRFVLSPATDFGDVIGNTFTYGGGGVVDAFILVDGTAFGALHGHIEGNHFGTRETLANAATITDIVKIISATQGTISIRNNDLLVRSSVTITNAYNLPSGDLGPAFRFGNNSIQVDGTGTLTNHVTGWQAPYSTSGNTVDRIDTTNKIGFRRERASVFGWKTFDWADLATATTQSTTVTVTGAVVGDVVLTPSMDVDVLGTVLRGVVTAADTVTVYQRNDTGANQNIASGNLYVEVVKRPF